MASWSSPACLITPDPENNTFVLNEETANRIQEINNPLVIVCVSGPLRQGKSSLMNRLMKFLFNNTLPEDDKGFAVNSTRNAMTKGFWAWYVDHPEDRDKGILVIDVEGLGDTRNKAYDNCLLCLSILLSSVFVYNVSSETIDRELIDKLHFVKISEHIQQQMNESDDILFDDPFPVLVVVLRNVSLDSEGESNEYYLDQRLRAMCFGKSSSGHGTRNITSGAGNNGDCGSEGEEMMTLSSSNSEEYSEGSFEAVDDCKDKVKKLTDYFINRKLFMLPIPVTGKEKTSQTHVLPDIRLKREFVNEVRSFCNYISSNAPVKMLHQKSITGQMFIDLVRKYLQHLDTRGFVSRFGFDVKKIIEHENNLAIEKSIAIYREKMKSLSSSTSPVTSEELNLVHSVGHEVALKYFMRNMYLDGRNECHQKLKTQLDEAYDTFFTKNIRLSSEVCKVKIRDLSSLTFLRLEKKEYCCSGGYEKLRQEVEDIKLRYQAIPDKGIMADAEWNDFMNTKMEVHLNYVLEIDKFLTKSDKINKGSEMERDKEMRRICLKTQSENVTEKYQEVMNKGKDNQLKLIEDAYQRRIGDSENFYIGRIGELRREERELRIAGLNDEASLIDEEISNIERRQVSTNLKMKEIIRTVKEWLHLARPILEIVYVVLQLYQGRQPPGRPFIV